MTKARISIIACIAGSRRVLGNQGRLVAAISADLKRFKSLTLGHPIIMGRKTLTSIGRALPGRVNIVITRNGASNNTAWPEGVVVCTSIENALAHAANTEAQTNPTNPELFIIGGGEIYNQSLSRADRLYLTVVDTDPEGDAFFPEYEHLFTKVITNEKHFDETTGRHYRFLTLEKTEQA